MNIEQALQALRENPGDALAWEILYVDAYQPLLAYVSSLLLTFRVAPPDTAHDIVHDVMIGFLERWPVIKEKIHSVAALRAYLRRSCRNLLVDLYRSEQRAKSLVDFLALQFSTALGDESDLYRSVFVDEIIAMLPRDCASLLRQYVEEDLSPAEIADREGASAATFYSRWYRCIQKAKKIFMQKKSSP